MPRCHLLQGLSGVGQHLQDHINGPLMFRLNRNISANDVINSMAERVRTGLRYAFTRKGFLAMGVSVSGGFFKVDPAAVAPEIQSQVMLFSSHDVGGMPHPFPGATVVNALLRPESRGHVNIVSPDPFVAPEIQPNYLATAKDRRVAADAIRVTRRICAQPALAPFEPEEYRPGPEFQSQQDLEREAGNIGTTIFHPVGTCKMGSDSMAVVDDRLRVHGLESLRVIDASIMPTLVSGNTNAPTIMIAEKAADLIHEDNPWR